MRFGNEANRHIRLTVRTPQWDRNGEWALLLLTLRGEVLAEAHYLVSDLEQGMAGVGATALVAGQICVRTTGADTHVHLSLRGRDALSISKAELRTMLGRRTVPAPFGLNLAWLSGR